MEEINPTWNPPRQCTGTSRNGERCRRNAIPGGSVCVMHGGSIPSVRAAARTRLLAMVEPVLGVFEEIVTSWRDTQCEVCGQPTTDPTSVIRVGQLVLDRAGFGPSATMQVVTEPNRFAELTEDQLIDRLEMLLAAAKARRDAHRPVDVLDVPALSAPEDVHVVSEDDAAPPQPAPIQNPGGQIPTGKVIPDKCIEDK